jgi:hypothetical protein
VELVPFEDSAALASALSALLSDDDERRELAQNGAKFVQSHSWPEIGRQYLDMIRGLGGAAARGGWMMMDTMSVALSGSLGKEEEGDGSEGGA